MELRADVRLTRDGVPFAACDAAVDVCDARRFGSLYRRVLERVVVPDTDRQREYARLATLDVSHHPWFPVLTFGADKADLYTRALVGDIVHGNRNLTDPRWLLRVGLYLEVLACLDIFEAVRDDVGDLLTPVERRAWETSAGGEEDAAEWSGPREAGARSRAPGAGSRRRGPAVAAGPRTPRTITSRGRGPCCRPPSRHTNPWSSCREDWPRAGTAPRSTGRSRPPACRRPA